MQKRLCKLGFYQLIERLPDLCKLAQELADTAGTNKSEGFLALPSFLPFSDGNNHHPLVLAVDIGGTFTKAGLRQCKSNGELEWRLLFEHDNDDLRNFTTKDLTLEAFFRAIGQRVVESVQELGVPLADINRCGVVWSNTVENRLLPDRCGVTGIVVHRDDCYRKGEWFVNNIVDGDDVGAIFQAALQESGVPVSSIVLTNDTPFTMKALPGSDSGIVLSTGLNGTIVKMASELGLVGGDEGIVCNAEMGKNFALPMEWMSEIDRRPTGVAADTIEELCSGLFLPRLFRSAIAVLASQGCDELSPFAAEIAQWPDGGWGRFSARDLSLLVSDPVVFKQEQHTAYLEGAALECLVDLARELLIRSAKLGAVVIFASIANRISSQDQFLIALDSRLAREIPLYREILLRTVEGITPKGKTIQLTLLDAIEAPGGGISVPMQGAANALDCFA